MHWSYWLRATVALPDCGPDLDQIVFCHSTVVAIAPFGRARSMMRAIKRIIIMRIAHLIISTQCIGRYGLYCHSCYIGSEVQGQGESREFRLRGCRSNVQGLSRYHGRPSLGPVRSCHGHWIRRVRKSTPCSVARLLLYVVICVVSR